MEYNHILEEMNLVFSKAKESIQPIFDEIVLNVFKRMIPNVNKINEEVKIIIFGNYDDFFTLK